jgi:hypothetical protein
LLGAIDHAEHGLLEILQLGVEMLKVVVWSCHPNLPVM